MAAPRGLSGPLADPAAAVEAIRDRMVELVTGDADQIFRQADARWPIRTGKSKRGLYQRDDSAGNLIIIRIGNTVDYARFIRSVKVGRENGRDFRPVLTRELGDPVRIARRTLAPRAADLTAQVLDDL